MVTLVGKGAVWKAVEPQGSAGSSPAHSAEENIMTQTEDEKAAEGCLIFLGSTTLLILLFFGNIFLTGYVASVLWNWFVVPFFDLPELTMFVFAGISILVKTVVYIAPYAVPQTVIEAQELSRQRTILGFYHIFYTLMAWGVGGFIRLFI